MYLKMPYFRRQMASDKLFITFAKDHDLCFFTLIVCIIETTDFILLLISGLLGGFIGGMLGIGGAPVFIAFFWYVIPDYCGTEVSDSDLTQLVIANTVFVRTFAAFIGFWKHYQLGNFYWKTVRTISIPATIVSIFCIWILSKFHYSKTAFSISFIIIFIPLLYRMLKFDANQKAFNQPYRIKVIYLNLLGIVCGLVTALSGLGAGFVILPLMNSFFNIKIRKTASISLGVIFISSLFVIIYYFIFPPLSAPVPHAVGAILLPVTLPVVAASFFSSSYGVSFSRRLSPHTLQKCFILFCVVLIVHELWVLFA